ncbi:MAG: GntR family transcriptional regulator [Oscillospiraceae bacterium]
MTNKLIFESEIPLYIQLKEILSAQIRSGIIKSGEKIMTEMELTEEYSVSRITARRAVTELVNEGLLTRRQGKGTFAKGQKINERIMENRSFTELVLENGMVPSTKLISISLQPADENDIALLKVTPGDKVLYFQRIRYIDDKPVMIENNFFPKKYSPLIQHDLEKESVYSLLVSEFGVNLLRPTKTIEIAHVTESESKYLNCKKGDPVILVRELIFDENGVPVHRTKQIITGDRFIFEII